MANATATIRNILRRVAASNRPPGVSLRDAERIMGQYFHPPREIKAIFHLDDAFLMRNAHIGTVPFTAEELAWAARFRILLTLTCPVSMNAFLRNFSTTVSVADEIKRGMRDYLREVPQRLEWRLVMRPNDERDEERALLSRPRTLVKERLTVPSLRLLTSALFVDWRLNGVLPTPLIGARFTKDAIVGSGGTMLHRVIVDGGVVSKAPIRVITGQTNAPFRFAMAFLPQTH